VATDGAEELLGPPPSLAETVSFDTLVHDRRLFSNASLLRKRLLVLSERGRFWDDATIGIVRRLP
jgi:hypothetical protein